MIILVELDTKMTHEHWYYYWIFWRRNYI